jgi:predicted nucleic acid-binding Zn ribbon protein
VRSFKDRVDDIADDQKKQKRAFTFIWVVAYSMMILGFILIVWVLFLGN